MAKRVTKKAVNPNEMDGKEFFEAIHQIEQENAPLLQFPAKLHRPSVVIRKNTLLYLDDPHLIHGWPSPLTG